MSLLFALTVTAAHATAGFDASTAAATFTGEQTHTVDGDIQLWGAIERHSDPDRTLFTQEDFNSGIAWPDGSKWAPWIADCFGEATPHSGDFLLHLGSGFDTAAGTPVLFVPGAGDNASRGFVTMAARMDNSGRPVAALTFAHPHGDVFQHAEQVANAVARLKALTGAAEVDLVSHSKGGIATAIYLSNHTGADWGRDDYDTAGTEFRGDVRRAVFIATPLGGVDTSYRWPGGNTVSLDADTAVSPSSWESYYPYGYATWWIETSLEAQDFFPEGGDIFPGQRQLLARWDDVYDLPGEQLFLGPYALQQDWYTTYYGGPGFYSYSSGIDAAIAEGDDVLGHLAANGVDPDVELFILAGENPLMPNGTEDFLALYFGEAFVDLATLGTDTWAELVAELVGNAWVAFGVSEAEVQGLVQGKLLFGEISGPSDGVVFVDSALQTSTLTARGAAVLAVETRDLSHLDLLYASPLTGQLLKDEAAADPTEDGWKDAVGDRYIAADTLGWVESVLADPASEDDGGGTGEDGGDGEDGGGTDGGEGHSDDGGGDGEDGGDGDHNEGAEGGEPTEDADEQPTEGEAGTPKSGGCSAVPAATGGALALLAVVALAGRRENPVHSRRPTR